MIDKPGMKPWVNFGSWKPNPVQQLQHSRESDTPILLNAVTLWKNLMHLVKLQSSYLYQLLKTFVIYLVQTVIDYFILMLPSIILSFYHHIECYIHRQSDRRWSALGQYVPKARI